MKTEQELCSLGITGETLAAWHDATLDSKETRRISDHLPTCPACQARLAEYTQLDQAIRSQRVPVVGEQLWQDIRTGMSGMPATSGVTIFRRTKRGGLQRRQLLGSLGALAAAILVVVGFLRVFQLYSSARPTAKATATVAKLLNTPTPLPTVGPARPPVPGTPPNWQQHILPVPYVVQQTEVDFGVAPSDGTTAYLCYSPNTSNSPPTAIWATHDSGTHWTHVGNLPVPSNIGVAQCIVEVDTLNSANVLVLLSWTESTNYNIDHTDWFLSTDGGVSWTTVVQAQDFTTLFQGFTTNQGKAYAIQQATTPWPADEPTPTPVPNRPNGAPVKVNIHLAVSNDGLHTWQPLDQPILALVGTNEQVKQFWAMTGANGQTNLLADVGIQGFGTTSQPDTLWTSHDGGAHWTQLPAPQASGTESGYIAQATADGRTWYMCSVATDGSYSHPSITHIALACSTDGGKTWVARPTVLGFQCCEAAENVLPTFLTRDGSLLSSAMGFNTLYRLPPNSNQWQSIGSTIVTAYGTTPNGGVLWNYNIGHVGNATNVFYTAAYPG